MAVVNFTEEPGRDGIDLDRVIVDPDYRRRVMEKLRAEASPRPLSEESSPPSGNDD